MNEPDFTSRPIWWRRLAGLLITAIALGLYLTTMSWGAFPGLPAQNLAWHLGLNPMTTLLDSLWGRLIRLCLWLPGGNISVWMGIISAVCGAACVGLVVLLVMRLRYVLHDANDPDEIRRENQARLLAGITAGLFLMASIPFWILSTRSLPGTFHILMLLGATWLFSEYQRTGAPSRLYLIGLLYGIGITEFATFWVFAPLAAILIMRAMLQRAEFSWPVLIRTGLCLLPGLLLYVLNGWTLWHQPAIPLRGFSSMWSVIWFIWRDQWHLIVRGPQMSGFVLVMALVVIPWGVLFLMRAKKPAWRYSAWPVGLRLLVVALALGTLFNAPFGPWRIFGMSYLMAMPYIILAACAGYVAGEFWVMGQIREHRNAGVGQLLRSALGILGLMMAIAGIAAIYWNLPVADGRPGTQLKAITDQIIADLNGRDILLANGALDDSIRLAAQQQGQSAMVISVPMTASAPYRQYLTQIFTKPRQQSLLQIGFGAFLQDFLAEDQNLQKTAALDLADFLQEFGYLVPNHLLFIAVSSPDQINLPQIMEEQKPFWTRMEYLAHSLVSPQNPAYDFQHYVLRLAGKVANNLGFIQAEQGDVAGAAATFEQARRIDPKNISALLNLLTLGRENKLPNLAQYETEWKDFKQQNVDPRLMWSLSAIYGYVYNSAFLVRQGIMWAVSGKPQLAEAELRRASGAQEVKSEVKAFLGRAYLNSGDLQRSSELYRAALTENPKDVRSLLMLADIMMNKGDFEEAAQLLDQAEQTGLEQNALRFERAALAYLKGEADGALAGLKTLVQQDKTDLRAWALLAIITADGSDPGTFSKALEALKDMQGGSPDVRLVLAELYMKKKDWNLARSELEEVVRMNPRQIRAWEMLVNVDFQERKRELAEDHVRVLLTLDPENAIGNLMLGSFQYARGQYSLAESSYRTALKSRRDATTMNDLAYLLMIKGGDLEDARNLVNEALEQQPQNPIFLSTRSELNLIDGRLDDAERDLQQVLAMLPGHPQALLLSARLYVARGQKAAARELVDNLSKRQSELPAEQQTQLQALQKNLQ
mgnify:CR=1 FL=1